MFHLKRKNDNNQSKKTAIALDALKTSLANLDDAKIVEKRTALDQPITIIYITTLIDQERLNESIIDPLIQCSSDNMDQCLTNAKIAKITTLEDAKKNLMLGSIVLNNQKTNEWMSIQLEKPLSRSIEQSVTETVIYGAKDSFSEQIDDNITLIRRRLPLAELKTEKFHIGYLS